MVRSEQASEEAGRVGHRDRVSQFIGPVIVSNMQRFGVTIASKALRQAVFRAPAVNFSAQRWMSTRFTESHEYIKVSAGLAY